MAESDERAVKDDGDAKKNVAKRKPLWARCLSPKGIAILVGASIVIHGIGFVCSKVSSDSKATAGSAEVDLGEFRFIAGEGAGGSILGADFALHIALLDQVGPLARNKLQARQFRVQQDIEELLRQAHGGDFEDPTLSELKRQLQEQINETLGLRAIDDVIITDLTLTLNDKPPKPITETAANVPWKEKPSE